MLASDRKRPRILVLITEHLLRDMMTPENRALLDSLGEVTLVPHFRSLNPDEYARLFDGVDAVVTGWGVQGFPDDLFTRAPGLRIIAHSAGSVHFMPRYLLERGVVITSAKSAIAPTVGEMALLLAIAGFRSLRAYDRDRDGHPLWEHSGRARRTLFDRKAGLVGFGDTAREFRALLRPFRCPVSVYDPFLVPSEAERYQVAMLDFETLLRANDLVSLHLPALPETRNMIGRNELAMLRHGAVLVNTARGSVIDMEALIAEAETGRIQVCLDVSDPEPLPPGHPLWSLPNVIVFPHIAGPTVDHLPRLLKTALEDLKAFLDGDEPLHRISLEVYDRLSF